MKREKTCYKFKRLWQDYRQYIIGNIMFNSIFSLVFYCISDFGKQIDDAFNI